MKPRVSDSRRTLAPNTSTPVPQPDDVPRKKHVPLYSTS